MTINATPLIWTWTEQIHTHEKVKAFITIVFIHAPKQLKLNKCILKLLTIIMSTFFMLNKHIDDEGLTFNYFQHRFRVFLSMVPSVFTLDYFQHPFCFVLSILTPVLCILKLIKSLRFLHLFSIEALIVKRWMCTASSDGVHA